MRIEIPKFETFAAKDRHLQAGRERITYALHVTHREEIEKHHHGADRTFLLGANPRNLVTSLGETRKHERNACMELFLSGYVRIDDTGELCDYHTRARNARFTFHPMVEKTLLDGLPKEELLAFLTYAYANRHRHLMRVMVDASAQNNLDGAIRVNNRIERLEDAYDKNMRRFLSARGNSAMLPPND